MSTSSAAMDSQIAAQADRTCAHINHDRGQMIHAHLDLIAFGVGALGFGLLVAGIACIYWPAALIVAGTGLLAWSFMAARAVSTRNAGKNQEH